MTIIKIQNYIPELINLDDTAFTKRLDDLIDELSVNQPYTWMIKGSINNATRTFVSDPNRNQAFQRLVDFDLNKIAVDSFKQVIELLPTPLEQMTCHIFPAVELKGGGACFAPGHFLLSIRSDELAPMRLKRNVAHEYSHTIRGVQKPMETEFGFGEAVPYSMRDYLVMEGLACVLGETLYSHPDFPAPQVSEAQETEFWNNTDLYAVGINTYIKYMKRAVYEISARIVRKYLETHNVSIIDAHFISDDELYWKSGYPFIK